MIDRLEAERHAKIRQLEDKERQFDAELARINKAKADVHAKKLRVQAGKPDETACTICWEDQGIISHQRPTGPGNKRGWDLWTCPTCGDVAMREA